MQNDLIKWRRDFHRHPELGFNEVRTSSIVTEELKRLGIDEIQNLASTGIAAMIRGEEEGPTIMLRADMDALPIHDEKTVSYSSIYKNAAHLCGHDAHTAILLGTARLLCETGLKQGNVKLVFQPAEEGLAGARAMIQEGVLENPKVNAVVALHVQPSLPTGQISVCPNACTANSDRFNLVVHGTGGHAAHPHKSVDSVTIAADIISCLQKIISRQIDPLNPAVITIGKIEGGFARNVIAPSVKMEGTIRTLDLQTRVLIPQKLEKIVKGFCDSFGATYELEYMTGYPSVVNDPSLIPLLQKTAASILAPDCFNIDKPSMGGEDFSYFTEHISGLYFRLGTRNEEKGFIYQHHHPLFDIDEDALPLGAALLAEFVLEYLFENRNTKNSQKLGR
ncbi:amidohydrolase [Peribacillus cavernae]|uniref:Amidohydrolase n=1 Tax=Peribacillus cavernae TaxID=1674310 RepID=A0A433HTD2_9BACI|nr:amidohydrolase [Peribacillus cavernae]MDQ0218607.1 amidohydrolase [Peribacillus cavernae]RUQ31592.1 amidohydrolase [Peribacillus cavernae]